MYKTLIRDPRPWAILFSIALSLILGWDALVSSDGILYLRSAAAFAKGDYQTAFTIYPWAFYSSMIALTAQITTLSFEHGAVVLNAVLYGIMVAGFITVVKKMGGDTTTQWFAFITFAASPALNDYREFIVRDFGQWAFLPWAIYFYLCCYEKVTFKSGMGWTLSIIIAFLFRIEAILIILIAPFMLLFLQTEQPLYKRIGYCIKLYALLGLLALIGVAFLVSENKLDMLGRFATLEHTLRFMILETTHTYFTHAQHIATELSVSLKPEHASIILGSGLFFYLLYTVIKVLNIVYFPFVIITLWQNFVPRARYNRCIAMFIGLYLITVMQHLSQQYFLSSRYVMPIVLCLMLWVPFSLEKILEFGKIWLSIIGLVFIYLFVSGVTHFGYSKNYPRQAGEWIAQHAKPNAILLSTSPHALYYSHRDLVWNDSYTTHDRLMTLKSFKPYDYIIVSYHRRDEKLLSWLKSVKGKIVASYENKRGDGIVIIQTSFSATKQLSQPIP